MFVNIISSVFRMFANIIVIQRYIISNISVILV